MRKKRTRAFAVFRHEATLKYKRHWSQVSVENSSSRSFIDSPGKTNIQLDLPLWVESGCDIRTPPKFEKREHDLWHLSSLSTPWLFKNSNVLENSSVTSVKNCKVFSANPQVESRLTAKIMGAQGLRRETRARCASGDPCARLEFGRGALAPRPNCPNYAVQTGGLRANLWNIFFTSFSLIRLDNLFHFWISVLCFWDISNCNFASKTSSF